MTSVSPHGSSVLNFGDTRPAASFLNACGVGYAHNHDFPWLPPNMRGDGGWMYSSSSSNNVHRATFCNALHVHTCGKTTHAGTDQRSNKCKNKNNFYFYVAKCGCRGSQHTLEGNISMYTPYFSWPQPPPAGETIMYLTIPNTRKEFVRPFPSVSVSWPSLYLCG